MSDKVILLSRSLHVKKLLIALILLYNVAYKIHLYHFSYDATDGSSRAEQGQILNPGTKDAALDVQGAVRWYDDKGQLYEMTYKAGKRGYRTIIKKVKQRYS